MAGRIAAALVALVLLAGAGAAAGYVVAQDEEPLPTTFATPESVPAASPGFPVNVYDVEDDPDAPPLAKKIDLHEEGFGAGGFRLRAPVPDGWRRVRLSGNNQWNFTVADNPLNTYLLRIGILAGERRTTGVAAGARLLALRAQEADGNSENLIVEEQSDTGFVATAIIGGYQRVIMERFLTVPGNTSAYFTVVMNGREVDREAMTELLDRVVAGATVP